MNQPVTFDLDPTCSLSGVRDHAREAFMARANTEQVVRRLTETIETCFNKYFFVILKQAVPVYEHLFSDLRQYPRVSYRIQSRDPVPSHVSRQWLGQADAHREQIAISRL